MVPELEDFKSKLSKIVQAEDGRAALRFCQALEQSLAKPASSADSGPILSVVIPVYNEEESLHPLYRKLVEVLSQTGYSFEVLFVDDGSSDKSQIILEEIALNDPQVTVVQLARNFGQQVALSAGLEHSKGKGVICMDADMQDSPEAIHQLIQKWQEGYSVVYGRRIKRKENVLKRIAYSVFYRLLRLIANIRIPLDAGDFCLMDRQVVDSINAMPERNRFLRGIRSWVGFSQIGIPIERNARDSGQPKYTVNRLISLALDGLISFSVRPLRFITYFGLAVSACSILLAIYYTFKRVTVGLTPPGFATIVVFVSFFAGVQLITIGVIGE